MRKLVVITMCLIIFLMSSGCDAVDKLGLRESVNDEVQPVSSVVMNEDDAKKLSDKVPIHLYFSNQTTNKLNLEVRYIPLSEAKKSVNNLATVIVKELVKGPSPDTGLKATIPADTKLYSGVIVNSGTAIVDLSQDFINKHPGGKVEEQLTIYSIVNSLTELKEISKVKFLINGKDQKEFKGNYRLDASFPRSPSLIGKSATPQTLGNTINSNIQETLDNEILE
jgi:germination protein M